MTPKTLLAVVATTVVATVLVLQVMWLDDPWDGSQGGEISGGLTEYSCKAFDAHGWAELGGRPAHFFLPWDVAVLRPLDHHPPAPFAAYYLSWRSFGRGPAALRGVSLVLLVASLAGIAVAGRAVAAGAGAVAAALLAASPVTVHYACIAEGMPWSVAFMTISAAAWARWRASGSKGALLLFQIAALAGSVSAWYGAFLLPALWLGLLIARKNPGRARAAVVAAVPFAIGVVAFAGWITWSGGLERLAGLWSEVVDILAGRDGVYADADIVLGRDLLRHARAAFTDPFLVAAAWGAVSSLLRGLRSGRTAEALPFVVLAAGVFMQVAFGTRSATHAYLSLILVPGVALCGARAVLDVDAMVSRRFRSGVAVALVLAAGGFGIWEGYGLRDASRTERSVAVARRLDAELGERDVAVMFGTVRLPTLNVTSTRSILLLPKASDRGLWDEACSVLRPGKARMGRLFVLAEEALVDSGAMPWVSGLPIIVETARVIDAGAVRWWIAEVDKERALGGS